MTRRITAPHARPPFAYDLLPGQPSNLMFAGSTLFSHGYVLPVLRLHSASKLVPVVAAGVPGFADAVGMWFPSFLGLPFKFDPMLISERIAKAARERLDVIRERAPDATRIEMCLHGGFEVRLDQAEQLTGLIAKELPDPTALDIDDIANGTDRYRGALAMLNTLERSERLLHFFLAVLHHVLAHRIEHLVVTDEDPCETTTIWLDEGDTPSPERGWRASTLYKSFVDQDPQDASWTAPLDDPRWTIEQATMLAAFLPWSAARHLQLARVLARQGSPESTIIHATEALFLAEKGGVPDDALGELHALRGLAWDEVRYRYPRALDHAARDLTRAFKLGVRLERNVMLRLMEHFS